MTGDLRDIQVDRNMRFLKDDFNSKIRSWLLVLKNCIVRSKFAVCK